MVVDGNEISGVNSQNVGNLAMYGIKVEQVKNGYNLNYFPDEPEATVIKNNIIWGISTATTDPHRIGIALLTLRKSPLTWVSDPFTAMDATYMTSNDMIVSNTVIMDDDAGLTTGMLAGISVMHAKNTKIINNAVAVLDNNIDNASKMNACIFYQGIIPTAQNGLLSNRNAFYKIPKAENNLTGPAFYGFYELDQTGKFVEPLVSSTYNPNGYETIRQWRNWTGQDINSIEANWLTGYTQTGIAPYKYRITTPTPQGSPLNNRGYRLDDVYGAAAGFGNDIKDTGCTFGIVFGGWRSNYFDRFNLVGRE